MILSKIEKKTRQLFQIKLYCIVISVINANCPRINDTELDVLIKLFESLPKNQQQLGSFYIGGCTASSVVWFLQVFFVSCNRTANETTNLKYINTKKTRFVFDENELTIILCMFSNY